LPQAPQWALLVCRSRHTPAQSVVPWPQLEAQRPALQSCPAGQALPHMPQWALSVCRSRHTPPQAVAPMGQLTPQTPRSQTCPLAQALPQAPQLARSPMGSTQTATPPSSPPQRRRFAAHSSPQRPSEHTCPEGQALPHVPQLARSVCTLAQTPLQRVCEVGQLWVQAPLTQTLPAGQAMPQAPQCCGLVWGFTHRPSHARSPAAQTTSAGGSAASTGPGLAVGLLHACSATRAETLRSWDHVFDIKEPPRRGGEAAPVRAKIRWEAAGWQFSVGENQQGQPWRGKSVLRTGS
jgi:hypothetical protein